MTPTPHSVAAELKRRASAGAVALGAHVPEPAWQRVELVARRSRVARALAPLTHRRGTRVSGRLDVYAVAADALRGQPVTYLEFGVHEGKSLRFFSRALDHPATRLHAFDSFLGLPEDWNAANPLGTFSTQGTPPDIADERVEFHVGWFADTLTDFSLANDNRLFVNIDCDLYTSTVTVLDAVGRSLNPGDLVYFDEFADLDHEFRAFHEFAASGSIGFSLVARSESWNNVLLRVEPVAEPLL
jgi:hypothetical protein